MGRRAREQKGGEEASALGVLKEAGLDRLELAIGDERELSICHGDAMLNS